MTFALPYGDIQCDKNGLDLNVANVHLIVGQIPDHVID